MICPCCHIDFFLPDSDTTPIMNPQTGELELICPHCWVRVDLPELAHA